MLGLIGCGNVGSIVADRAIGLRMRVIAFDPFLSPERAFDLGVEKVELDELLARADFVSLHTPVTPQTKNILSAENLARTKPGALIINSCRAALVDETALLALLESGHIGGVAIDVSEKETPADNPLFLHPNVICTPHLGAATREAQEKVALQIAEQMSDYLTRDAISNAVNFPAITAEEAPKLKPFIALADRLGSFAGQLIDSNVRTVSITYEGAVAELKIKALTASMIAALLRPLLAEVNVVSAPEVAKAHGIVIEEVTRAAEADFEFIVTLRVEAGGRARCVSGTVFNDGKPRIISINEIKIDAAVGPSMIYVTNEDKPGFIGRFASVLGDAGVNIATFALGRDCEGGSSIALVEVDRRRSGPGARRGRKDARRQGGEGAAVLIRPRRAPRCCEKASRRREFAASSAARLNQPASCALLMAAHALERGGNSCDGLEKARPCGLFRRIACLAPSGGPRRSGR